MFGPREMEMLAEARIEEWRDVILPEISRRSVEQRLVEPAAQTERPRWRMATAWLRGRLATATGA